MPAVQPWGSGRGEYELKSHHTAGDLSPGRCAGGVTGQDSLPQKDTRSWACTVPHQERHPRFQDLPARAPVDTVLGSQGPQCRGATTHPPHMTQNVRATQFDLSEHVAERICPQERVKLILHTPRPATPHPALPCVWMGHRVYQHRWWRMPMR